MLVSTFSFSQTQIKQLTLAKQLSPSKIVTTFTKVKSFYKVQSTILHEDRTSFDTITKIKTAINEKQLSPSNLTIIATPTDKSVISEIRKPIQKSTSQAKKFKSATIMTFEKAKD